MQFWRSWSTRPRGSHPLLSASLPRHFLCCDCSSWNFEKDIDEVLQTHTVFSNVSKGQLSKKEELMAAFGTDDQLDICKIILEKGDLQVSEKERQVASDQSLKEVSQLIASMVVNPDTKRPIPPSVIDKALHEMHFSLKPNRSSKQQALDAIPKLRETIKIERAKMKIRVAIPTKEAKTVHQKLKALFNEVEVDDWAEEGLEMVKESAIRKKKDRESRRLRRAASTEKEKMMERISNSQSKLETRLSEMQERAEERRASLRSNAKAKRASETKEQRTERFTYHSTRYRNKNDEKNATTAKNAFGGEPEKYALRLMILYTKGATSFSDLKTTKDDNGIPTVHDTFVEAAKAQGFLSDDAVVIKSLEETAAYYMLRAAFSAVLAFSEIGDTQTLWNLFKKDIHVRGFSESGIRSGGIRSTSLLRKFCDCRFNRLHSSSDVCSR
uniref:Ribosome maturation protein SBDS n=1 Tax=Caenorhabditis japonica TaxID=281687 RepID=A0A8R1EA89_CAEJA